MFSFVDKYLIYGLFITITLFIAKSLILTYMNCNYYKFEKKSNGTNNTCRYKYYKKIGIYNYVVGLATCITIKYNKSSDYYFLFAY